MYTAHLVAAVQVNGKTVREFESNGSKEVFLPFGSDYSLYLKNMDTRRAVVSIEIDGEDILDGTQIVLDGNSSTTLEGFLNNSTGLVKNQFRFIEKTDKVREHRGEKAEDGLIRIEFQYEEPQPTLYHIPCFYKGIRGSGAGGSPMSPPGTWCSTQSFSADGGSSAYAGGQNVNSINNITRSVNDQGITVAGAEAHQQFGRTSVGRLDPEKHVMVLMLRGDTNQDKPVVQVITTRKKTECPSCGTKSKSSARFCSECSTALV